MTEKLGLERLDFAEAKRIGELVQIKIDGFLSMASNLPGEGYEEVYKEAYVELLFNGILKMNDNEDPRKKINHSKISLEVVGWYEKAAIALDEEEALREKYRKALSGGNLTEH